MTITAAGEICGLPERNSAGNTTLVKILLDIVRAASLDLSDTPEVIDH